MRYCYCAPLYLQYAEVQAAAVTCDGYIHRPAGARKGEPPRAPCLQPRGQAAGSMFGGRAEHRTDGLRIPASSLQGLCSWLDLTVVC